jgi:SOS-response transcriptional repressor LexA
MKTPTPRQRQVLDFIKEYRHLQGYSPILQEVADNFGFSRFTAHHHVNELIDCGLLRRRSAGARDYEVLEGSAVVSLKFPICGEISSAGVSLYGRDSGTPPGTAPRTS